MSDNDELLKKAKKQITELSRWATALGEALHAKHEQEQRNNAAQALLDALTPYIEEGLINLGYEDYNCKLTMNPDNGTIEVHVIAANAQSDVTRLH